MIIESIRDGFLFDPATWRATESYLRERVAEMVAEKMKPELDAEQRELMHGSGVGFVRGIVTKNLHPVRFCQTPTKAYLSAVAKGL